MEKETLLDQIQSPRDLDRLTLPQLEQLAGEIRSFLIDAISKTGGHLASNLGVVELTLAIHKVFRSPEDRILWDVGHQCYTHKILTGRKDGFATLRQENGLSGFPKPEESVHDAFIAGHSSNSISAGYGIAKALSLRGSQHHVVSVIGDGSFTSGMAYEAFNNAGRSKDNLVVILNHNDMSISKNVGAFAKYLSTIRAKQSYRNLKKGLERFLNRLPLIGKPVFHWLHSSKSFLKRWIYNTTFFEEMGFEYLGPVNGHDLEALTTVLTTARKMGGPVVVHVDTVKGKGYSFAEENPSAYHGVSKFDVETGNPDIASKDSFSTAFGKSLTKLAKNDPKICAITAAMQYGTGLQFFKKEAPERFFDVGIAEQHAVTFAAGLAAEKYKPVFAVYSSFLQRGYDQIIHDCAIENTHVVFAIDRAGIVGDDGETHQGVFDTVFLGSIPHVTLYAPESYKELEFCLNEALYRTEGVAALRYPRGSEQCDHGLFCQEHYQDYLYRKAEGSEKLLITYGRITGNVMKAAELLAQRGKPVSVLKLLKIIPLPEEAIRIAAGYQKIYFVEEGLKEGGIGQTMLTALYERGFRGAFQLRGIRKEFIKQGTVASTYQRYGLDTAAIVKLAEE